MDEAGDGTATGDSWLSMGETTDRSAGRSGIAGRIWWCWYGSWCWTLENGDDDDDDDDDVDRSMLGIEEKSGRAGGSVGRIGGGADDCRGEWTYWRSMWW